MPTLGHYCLFEDEGILNQCYVALATHRAWPSWAACFTEGMCPKVAVHDFALMTKTEPRRNEDVNFESGILTQNSCWPHVRLSSLFSSQKWRGLNSAQEATAVGAFVLAAGVRRDSLETFYANFL